MLEKTSFFKENKYVFISSFLDKENCQQYVDEFKKLIDEGQTTKDVQCPLSHALGHSVLFDSLLEQLTPHMETVTGKNLYPTYAYARWYAPGDELKIHKDRPACEISATITLGFEGGQWPIYVGNKIDKSDAKQINMNVGDAVVYKGEELFHWREKYIEGQWQAQVFIHYVDADGPHKEWKYDKRDRLSHHQLDPHDHFLYLLKENAFSKKSCEGIIDQFEKNSNFEVDALLAGDILDKSIRDTKKIKLPVDQGIGATLTGIGLAANFSHFKYDINRSSQCEYLKYDKDGHFSMHIDTLFNKKVIENEGMRKLTIILFLNDEFEGGKLFLKLGREKIYPNTSPGSVIIFPSFFLHGVEPITSGIRRSIVTWLTGPPLK